MLNYDFTILPICSIRNRPNCQVNLLMLPIHLFCIYLYTIGQTTSQPTPGSKLSSLQASPSLATSHNHRERKERKERKSRVCYCFVGEPSCRASSSAWVLAGLGRIDGATWESFDYIFERMLHTWQPDKPLAPAESTELNSAQPQDLGWWPWLSCRLTDSTDVSRG